MESIQKEKTQEPQHSPFVARKRLLDIVQYLPDATFVVDEERRVLVWNKAMEDLTGVSAAAVLGRGDYAYALPIYQELRPLLIDFLFEPERRVEAYYPFIKKTENALMVEGYTSKMNHQEAYLSIKASALYDHQGKVIGAIESIRDITERKRNDAALRYRAEFEKMLVRISTGFINAAPEAIDQGITETLRLIGEFIGVECGRVLLFSEGQEKMICSHYWGKDGTIVCSETIDQDTMIESSWLREQLSQGETVYVPRLSDLPQETLPELDQVRLLGVKSFVLVPMLNDGSLVGVVSFESIGNEKVWSEDAIILFKIVGETILNALDRKWKEAELRESEARYRLLIENSSDSICAVEDDGTILLMNSVAAGYFGGDPGDFIGRRLLDYLPKEYGENRMNDIGQVIQSGEARFVGEEVLVLQEQEYWFNTNVQPLIDSFGRITGAQITCRDITEHKKFNREMARLDRLNLVGQIAASFGHEVRNPLTTVHGFLQLLSEKEELSQWSDYFQIMIEEIDRSNSIISEFLSLAKNRFVDLKMNNLNAIVRGLYPLIQADALINDKQVKMELADTPELMLDENEIRQLTLNLARNGLEAMESGGTLTLETACHPDAVILTVRDQGSGIDPKIMDQIGTPFISTKESGTGLGLAICYSIASRHNARIRVETGPSGTAFHVVFQNLPGQVTAVESGPAGIAVKES